MRYESFDGIVVRSRETGDHDLLLSVDAFHQETVPLDTVKLFATEVKERGIPVRLSPAWLVSRDDDNPYNRKTREILDEFSEMNIPVGDGNIVFPEGNARIYLKEYFDLTKPHVNPYAEDPKNVKTLSVSPNGDVLDGNIYKDSILDIITNYGG